MQFGAPADPRTVMLQDRPSLLSSGIIAPWTWQAAKDPTSTVIRSVDFSGVLFGRNINGIAYGASGVVLVAAPCAGSVVTCVLQGGVDGAPGRVELRALCSDGTDETAAIILPIVAQITLTESDVMPASLSATATGTAAVVLGPLPVFAPVGASISVSGTVVARNTATGDTVSWTVAAVIKAFGTAGCVLDGAGSVTAFQQDAPLAGCTLAVSGSGGGIYLVATGVAGATLTWAAQMTWTEA